MKTIRVIHVVYSFATGGMEKGIATIVRHASEDFEHIILCLHSSGETARLLPEGTKIIELYKHEGNSPVFLWKLIRILKSLKPAIVHARNWGATDSIVAARLAGIKTTIQGEHGWLIDDPEGSNAKRLKIRRVLEHWTQEYTCVSQHLERWLFETVKVRKPVTQIYNAVDTRIFYQARKRTAIRTELGMLEKDFVVGVVGRLDPIKGHSVLFDAFAQLQTQHPHAKLLVVGDGPERSRLESLAGEGCLFLGNRLDVPAILQTLDVFVLPSRNEGISNTILEAMAAGLPVIATDVGGNPELVENGVTGSLIPPGNAQAIASALMNYIHSSDMRASHGNHGHMKVMQEFSIAKMVAQYETVYRRVASRLI